jgi:hypothetical protein
MDIQINFISGILRHSLEAIIVDIATAGKAIAVLKARLLRNATHPQLSALGQV